MIFQMIQIKRQITCALIAAFLLQILTPSIARTQTSPTITVQSGGEVLRSLFTDLRTTLGADADIKISYEKQSAVLYNIGITAPNVQPYRIAIRFGTGELANIPVEMVTENGRVDLSADWKNQFELFQNPPATKAETVSLVAPITTKIANFIVKDQERRSMRILKSSLSSSQTAEQDSEAYLHHRKLNRIEDRVMKIAFGVGAAISAVGAYMMFGTGNTYSYSMLPLGVFLSGTGVVVLNFANSLPEILEGERSYLGQLLESWFERKRYAREAIAIAAADAKEHAARAEVEESAKKRAYSFGQVDLVLSVGSMTSVKADAWIVPQFQNGENAGGVLAAVARSIGDHDASAFERLATEKGSQPFGSVTATSVNSAKHTKFLFNVVTVYSANELHVSDADKTRAEFQLIRDTLYEALKQASQKGLTSIALPLFGTGILGQLRTDSNSIQALLEAIKKFNADVPGAAKIKVTLATFTGRESFAKIQSFVERAEAQGIQISPQLNSKPRIPIVKLGSGSRCEAMFSSTSR